MPTDRPGRAPAPSTPPGRPADLLDRVLVRLSGCGDPLVERWAEAMLRDGERASVVVVPEGARPTVDPPRQAVGAPAPHCDPPT